MKKIWIVIVAIALILSACQGGTDSSVAVFDGLELDSVTVDTTMMLANRNDAPFCRLHITLVYVKGTNAQAVNDSVIHAGILVPDYFAIGQEPLTMKQVADSFIIRYLDDYKREFGAFYHQDPEHAASYINEYTLTTHVERGKDGMMVYLANSYLFAGGSHGTTTTIAKNVNVKTGKVMQLSDVFVEGFELRLNELIEKRLCKQMKMKTIDELRDKGIFDGIDVYATDNFIMGEKNMTFIYVEDEIAPHSMGEIRVVLDYGELNGIMKR